MNYIEEISDFYSWAARNSIPAEVQALWQALMHFNNQSAVKHGDVWHWPVEFTVSNTLLLSVLGMNRKSLERARRRLTASGRIEYKRGNGNRPGMYKMIPFKENEKTLVFDDGLFWMKDDTQADEQADEQGVAQSVAQSVAQGDAQSVAQGVAQSVAQSVAQNEFLHYKNNNNINNNTNDNNINSSSSKIKKGPVRVLYEELIGKWDVYTGQVLDSYGRSPELVCLAIREAHDNNACTLNYIKAILERYRAENITDPAKAARDRDAPLTREKIEHLTEHIPEDIRRRILGRIFGEVRP